jgi:hypothetical protein
VGFSKVLNFSTSAACPENVYVHGNSNPILKNLLPVTVANILYEIGEKLRCDREENNLSDKFAVKLLRNDGNKEQCVGHETPFVAPCTFLDGIYKLRSDQPNTHRLTDIRDISLGNVY